MENHENWYDHSNYHIYGTNALIASVRLPMDSTHHSLQNTVLHRLHTPTARHGTAVLSTPSNNNIENGVTNKTT